MNSLYHNKYIKYKYKYINLKQKSHDMTFYIKHLLSSNDKSFTFIDIELSENDKKFIKNLGLDPNTDVYIFNYFGKFDFNNEIGFSQFDKDSKNDHLQKNITNFLMNKDNTTDISKAVTYIIISKIIKPYTEATNKNYIWFTIRIMFPDNFFEIPRWHYDGYFYNSLEYSDKNLPQIKLAGVLMGPSTLFKKDNPEMRQKFMESYANLYRNFDRSDQKKDLENRKEIDTTLNKYPTFQPNENQAVVFKVGSKNNAAIHSEPNMCCDRIFYSVVSGNKEEIKELADRWGHNFIDF